MDKYTAKENYITRDPHPESWRHHPNNVILQRYSNYVKGRVLDFGCNHGACSFLLLDNNNVTEVLGLDLNQDAINVALETKTRLNLDNTIKFSVDNILTFTSSIQFDTIVTFHTLEHIYPEDVDDVLQRLYSLLREGGYLIISIPYDLTYSDCKEHVAFYKEDSLSSIFVKNKFTEIECYLDNNCGEGGILTGLFQK